MHIREKHVATLHKSVSCLVGSAPTSPPQASPAALFALHLTNERSTPLPLPKHKGSVTLQEYKPVQSTHSAGCTRQRPSNLHISSGGSAAAEKCACVCRQHYWRISSNTNSPSDDRCDSHFFVRYFKRHSTASKFAATHVQCAATLYQTSLLPPIWFSISI